MGKLLTIIFLGSGLAALVWMILKSEAAKEFTDKGVALVVEAPSHYKTGPDEYLKV